MAEKYANEFSTVLQGAITAGDTVLVVASATGAPGTDCRLKIDDEILRATVIVGTTFTVARGQEGTVAAAHADGAAVEHILTAGALTLAAGRVHVQSGGSFSTASTVFVQVALMEVVLTTAHRRALIVVNADGFNTTSATNIFLDVEVDGARLGGSDGLVMATQIVGNSDDHNLSFSYITDELAAGEHTFELHMRVSGGTGHLRRSSQMPLRMSVHELP